MIICETQFTRCPPDPKDNDIALHEVDFYAHVPTPLPTNPNHRLSLRYRRTTQQFEIYARYYIGESERVLWAGESFIEAIGRVNQIVKGQWGIGMGNDEICQHERPMKAFGCRWSDKPVETGA